MNTLSDEMNHAHFNEHASKIMDLLQDAGDSFFGEKAPYIVHDESEPVIRIGKGLIDIRPGVHEQKRIGGPDRYLYLPAFEIVKYKTYNQTRWEPEDVEDIVIETVRGPYQAAQSALVHWLKESMSGWFDAVGQAESYAEMEKME